MKTIQCYMTFVGETFRATMELPDSYFDEQGRPIYHRIKNRLEVNAQVTFIKVCEDLPLLYPERLP